MLSELDRYFMLLDRLSAEAQEIETGILPWLEGRVAGNDPDVLEALSLRQGLLTSPDRERVEGFLEIGVFPFGTDETRTAALVLTFELEDQVAAIHVAKQCERYSASQPLFRELPALLATARKEELVPVSEMEIRSDGIVAVAGVFARLGPFVPVAVIEHIRAEHPRAPLFVRLDPYFVAHDEPPAVLMEAVRVPPNPNWWRALAIRIGAREGGVYELDGTDRAVDDLQAFWDYRVRGVRRLETSAVRREHDMLAMMLEELQVGRGDELFGRCVHLDTHDVDGHTPDTARLSHLDLAINIYDGTDRRSRMEQYLRHGKVQDASRRTHLLRTEGVWLKDMIPVCERFFRSLRLTNEMILSEFV
jgi:hypothetical protein